VHLLVVITVYTLCPKNASVFLHFLPILFICFLPPVAQKKNFQKVFASKHLKKGKK